MICKYNYSVIIPHFSRDGNTMMLARAIASVPERNDIQVLVVDNSLTPIHSNLFSDRSNVTILYSANERRAGGARNVGIDYSDAKWLLFLDADDFFTADAFNVFDSHLESDNDVEFSLMTGAYSDDLSKRSDRGDFYANLVRTCLATGNDTELRLKYRSPCAKMVSADLVNRNNIRFDEVPASNDVMFSLKVGLMANGIGCDARETYVATVNQGSLTKTTSLLNIESRFRVCLRRNSLLKEYGYEKDSSVLLFVFKSLQFGIVPFFKLLREAAKSGDLFVGYKNWISTFFHLFNKTRRSDNTKYQVKE